MIASAQTKTSPFDSPSSLGKKARSAVIWNTGFNLFRDFLQFGVMLVLVRLVEPEAYGKFGLVTSIIGFISIFSFNNFAAHTLQVKQEDELHYQDHFSAGTAIQGVLFVLCNLVACFLWRVPAYAETAPLVHVMSLGFILSFPCDFRIKMLERQLDWKRLRLLHAGGLVITSSVAILLAMAGAGAYALLFPGILVALPFLYDLFIKNKWRPDWTWSWERYKAAWKFGLARSGSSLANNGRQLLESGVLAKILGFAVLGFLNRAIGLAQMFCVKFASQLMYTLYPLLAQYTQGTPGFRRISGLILRCVAWVVVPFALVFSALAEPVVNVIYGAKWGEVVSILPWGMAFGVAAALSHAGYMLLLASRKQNWCFILDWATLAVTALNLFLILPLGLIPYLAGLACIQASVFIFSMALLMRNASLDSLGLFNAVFPAAMSGIMAIALCEAFVFVAGVSKGQFGIALSYGTLFFLTYTILLRLAFQNLLSELVAYLPASKQITNVLRIRQH